MYFLKRKTLKFYKHPEIQTASSLFPKKSEPGRTRFYSPSPFVFRHRSGRAEMKRGVKLAVNPSIPTGQKQKAPKKIQYSSIILMSIFFLIRSAAFGGEQMGFLRSHQR